MCGRTVEARAAERARLVLMAADWASNRDIGAVIGLHYNPGRGVVAPLCDLGLAGLADGERSGRPPVYDHDDVMLLVKTVTPPPDQATRWMMEGHRPSPQRKRVSSSRPLWYGASPSPWISSPGRPSRG